MHHYFYSLQILHLYSSLSNHIQILMRCQYSRKHKKADITMPALYSLPIHISPLLHADVMVFPDDDVIETGDADDITCFDQAFRHLDVVPTWGRVPARMIVDGDKARRRQLERLTKHIAWVDD